MKVIRIAMPEAVRSNYYNDAPLDESELKQIEAMGVEEFRYYYGQGSYEGNGQAVFMKGGLWYQADLGHCSCYGPVDRIDVEVSKGFESIEKLKESCSAYLIEELAPLFTAMP